MATVAGIVLLVGKGGRPLAKQALKGYLVLSERARELTAQASEQLQDIYAEARAEMADIVERVDEGGESTEELTEAPARGNRRGREATG